MISTAATDFLPAALNISAVDPDSKKPEDLARQPTFREAVRPSSRKIPFLRVSTRLAGGNICLVFGYSVRRHLPGARPAPRQDRRQIAYDARPPEGSMLLIDGRAIPKEAPESAGATFLSIHARAPGRRRINRADRGYATPDKAATA